MEPAPTALFNRSLGLVPLEIRIVAKDGEGGTSETSTTISVRINAAPSSFEIQYFEFQTCDLTLQWTIADDRDGDEIVYDIFLGDITIATNYREVGEHNDFVSFFSVEDYSAVFDDEDGIVDLVITAKDSNGGETSVSQTIDMRGSDSDLGVLTEGTTTLEYDGTGEILDKTLGYHFQLEETTGIYILSSGYHLIRISDTYGGDVVASAYNTLSAELEAGTYYLEVAATDVPGMGSLCYYSGCAYELSIGLGDFTGTDMDLGTLAVPFESTFENLDVGQELDKVIRYYFTLEESTYYSFNASFDGYGGLSVHNAEGHALIQDGGGSSANIHGDLDAGSYYIALTSYDPAIAETLSLQFGNARTTDVDLGTLSIPYENAFENLDLSQELDRAIRYYFTLEESTYYSFSASFDGYGELAVYHADDNIIIWGSGSSTTPMVHGDLDAGPYYVEVASRDAAVAQTLGLQFGNARATDVDLGTLAIPYENAFENLDLSQELDRAIRYYFTLEESTYYNFSASFEGGGELGIYNADDDTFIREGGYSDGVVFGDLDAGSYYVEVESRNSPMVETLNLQFAYARATDVDLGTLSIPYENVFENLDLNQELDRQIAVDFTLEESGYYSFASIFGGYHDLALYAYKQGSYDWVNSTGGRDISLRGPLEPGTYRLRIGNPGYDDTVTGNLELRFEDPTLTDQDLGVVSPPYSNLFLNLDLNAEIDREMKFYFTMEEASSFRASATFDSSKGIAIFRSSDNAPVESDYYNNSLIGDLEPGSYFIALSSNGQNANEIGVFELEFRDAHVSDQELGTLSLPYDTSFADLDLTHEIDGTIRYSFTLDRPTGYNASATFDGFNEIRIYRANDMYAQDSTSGHDFVSLNGTLEAGSYFIELGNNGYTGQLNGDFRLLFGDPSATDIQLGVIEPPYSNSFADFELTKETDGEVRIYFVIADDTMGYTLSTSFTDYNQIALYNANDEYDYILDQDNDTHLFLRGILDPGAYYFKIGSDYGYGDELASAVTLSLDGPVASDVDLGTITSPYSNTIRDIDLGSEADGKIGYYFELGEMLDYRITADFLHDYGDIHLYHTDDLSQPIRSAYGGSEAVIYGELDPGRYYLEVENEYRNDVVVDSLNFIFGDATASDADWGVLPLPYSESISYDTSAELDFALAYTFELTQATSFSFHLSNGGSVKILDENGGQLYSGYSKIDGTLPAGKYTAMIGQDHYSAGVGILTVILEEL